ncbi:hypothetical protein [Streptomyces griseus]|uniref:hypothetical protein n=1 Tax=Streptomyces griseus TaxID=1911 RepID=UPI0037879DDD
MTTDQAVRDATARWARRRRRLIGYGQWKPFVEAEPVRQHVLNIRDQAGMSFRNLSAATGVSNGTLEHLIYGVTGYPPARQIRSESAAALLGYWPTLDDYADLAVIDATGTRRRMQALAALGWSAPAVHQRIDFVTARAIANLKAREQVTARLARAVRDFYRQVCGSPAEKHGVPTAAAKQARTGAARNRWPGPSAWDDDTIDDPDAKPDWTGHCGTDRGWWSHRQQDIPLCEACEQAHSQWKKEHGHLSRSELMTALCASKASASRRGETIAHDGRELLDQGYTFEHAAERLGITTQHLHQELRRHPAPCESEAA